jgi:hypothetical protein
VIGRDESGICLRTAIVAGLAGATLIASGAVADFSDAVVVRYQVEANEYDGTPVSVTVEDLYLLTDDPKDVDLNIYDVVLPESGRVPYFQSTTGQGWLPTNLGGPFDTTAVRYADSFVTVGGFDFGTAAAPQAPGAGGASALDPFFGGNDVAYPIDRAGWFNSSPPNLQGIAGQTPAGLGVLIGRFAYDGDFTIVGTQLSATWNQGIGTTGTQASFTVREFIDCNGNIVEDAVELATPTVAPYDGAVQWAGKGGNGHWYAWINVLGTHEDGMAWAADRGGYLATLGDPGEREFAISLIEPTSGDVYGYHIGGRQISPGLEPAGSWIWESGEPAEMLAWAPGEPNDQSSLFEGDEQYMEIRAFAANFGLLNDISAKSVRGYLVEWDNAADCNGNGILDGCDLVDGSSSDRNANRVPDECEALDVPGDHTTIQAAIDAAPDRGVVLVAPGTYNESLHFPADGRDIVLVSSDGADSTVINGSDVAAVILANGGQTRRSRVEGFTIQGGTTGSNVVPNDVTLYVGGGLCVSEASLDLIDCDLVGNAANYGGNAYFRYHTGEIRGCRFIGGDADSDGGNIQLLNSETVVADCEFLGGHCQNDGGGIKVVNGFVDMFDCSISGNFAGTGGGVMYFETVGVDTHFNFLRCSVSGNFAKSSGPFGGGFWARPSGNGPSLASTTVCDNEPDNFFGPYEDLGDNDICECPGDLNYDGRVNGTDLGLFLVYAGEDCQPDSICPGDLNGDDQVSGADLGILLTNWGFCQ